MNEARELSSSPIRVYFATMTVTHECPFRWRGEGVQYDIQGGDTLGTKSGTKPKAIVGFEELKVASVYTVGVFTVLG